MSIRLNKHCLFCNSSWDEMNPGNDNVLLIELKIDSICASCITILKQLIQLNENKSLIKDIEHIRDIHTTLNNQLEGDVIL